MLWTNWEKTKIAQKKRTLHIHIFDYKVKEVFFIPVVMYL